LLRRCLFGAVPIVTALIVHRDKAIKRFSLPAQGLKPRRGAQNPRPLDAQYDAVRAAIKCVFDENRHPR